MKMISMKEDASDKKRSEVSSPDNEYPYGARQDIHDEKVAALGLTGCSIGDEVMVMAKAKVVGKSEYENDSNSTKSVELQITDMAISKEESTTERAGKLYDNAG